MLNIILCAVTCFVMILGVLFFPKLRLGKLQVDTYWIIVLVGAAILLLAGQTDVAAIGAYLVSNSPVNPLKILVLFLSLSILSIYLDELGFFRVLAGYALAHTHGGQKSLFFSLYGMVALLTVFTSNDIIVLSFTPFICYFAREAKIDPIPYLAAEFVAANTWSMMLIIGNPTNIYLATAFGVGFVPYLAASALPTVTAGGVSLLLLWLLFRKKLREPLQAGALPPPARVRDLFSLVVGVVHLAACTVLLAISNYIGLEMWIAALSCVLSLLVVAGLSAAIRHKTPRALLHCVRRAPWQLVPFLLSMFVLSTALTQQGTTAALARALASPLPIFVYGPLSFFASNVMNNIPMSVFFASMLSATPDPGALFATIIGSNLGAFLTPIGALAGLMLSSIASAQGFRFHYADFLKLGVCVALPTLLATLGVLWGEQLLGVF